MISYCQQCVMPATKPGLRMDEEGVCSACRAYERRGVFERILSEGGEGE